ncbi:hypothetical protein GCM10009565_51650 [Amycolatopsis albidoflavus]
MTRKLIARTCGLLALSTAVLLGVAPDALANYPTAPPPPCGDYCPPPVTSTKPAPPSQSAPPTSTSNYPTKPTSPTQSAPTATSHPTTGPSTTTAAGTQRNTPVAAPRTAPTPVHQVKQIPKGAPETGGGGTADDSRWPLLLLGLIAAGGLPVAARRIRARRN